MSADYFAGLDREFTPRLQLPALIDMSFLMLIFFMVSATLQKQDADLDLYLPGIRQDGSSAVRRVEDMRVEIDDNGFVSINGSVLSGEGGRAFDVMNAVAERLRRYAAVVAVSKGEPRVLIRCSGAAAEQRFIGVLNACRRAGVMRIHVIE